MLEEELSSDMDRVTQLQDAILDLFAITHTAIEYITKRTQFEQMDPNVPPAVQTPFAAKREEYAAAIQTFVSDIVRRAKDVEGLIQTLPERDDGAQRSSKLAELQEELKAANKAYEETILESEALLKELQLALDSVLGDGRINMPSLKHRIEPADQPVS